MLFKPNFYDFIPLIRDGKVEIKQNANWFELGPKVKIVVVLEGNCQEVDLFITPYGLIILGNKNINLLTYIDRRYNIHI